MTTPLTTLPGDIPGLLRRGSPVRWRSAHTSNWTVTASPTASGFWLGAPGTFRATCDVHVRDVALDLTDPTGRWHAALWADAHLSALPTTTRGRAWANIEDMLDQAHQGLDMTPKQIGELARLVLRLAGRAQ